MNEFFKANPLAFAALGIMLLLLIGSFEHSWNMQDKYFQYSVVALLVVIAYEVGTLFVSWQKGADVMRFESSPAMKFFTGIVWLNILFSNLTESFSQYFGMTLNFANLSAGHDMFELIQWFVVAMTIPSGVIAMMYIVSKNISREVHKVHKQHLREEQQRQRPAKPDYSSMTVDEIKEALQRTLNESGFRGTVTDAMVAKELDITERQVRRRRKEEKDDTDDFLETVNVGTNGKYHID